MQGQRLLNAAVVVSALGYFVDVFDLLLFGTVRVKSLTALGLSGQALTDASLFLQNCQMVGLFVGGIGAGILGDRLGRVRALYLSIGLYAVGTLLNGFVDSVEMYALCRFVAGIGLAGELGTGITLVAESLPKERRGLGTTIVAAFGMSGAIAAGCMGWFVDDWRTAYFIGGGLGLVLLALRLSVSESPIFLKNRHATAVPRGNFWSFFTNKKRFKRLLYSTLLGVTTWFSVGILMLLAPEFGREKGLSQAISAGSAVVWFHVGMSLGDLGSGLLSQRLRSRLQAVRFFLTMQAVVVATYLFLPFDSAAMFYLLLALLGFSGGFWAVFMTNAAEQFGTNLRATAACVVPSFVRVAFVPIAMSFQFLKLPEQMGSPVVAAAMVGAVTLGLAFWASYRLQESFSVDLDYLE
ncbi:MAG: MFS transporter [Saprospiraceae bacterium]